MKINKKRAYWVDIYRAEKGKINAVNVGEDSVGFVEFEEKLFEKGVACIKVGCDYVPVEHVDGLFSYLELMSHEENKHTTVRLDSRFVGFVPNAQGFYVKNVRPMFSLDGKIELSELKAAGDLYRKNRELVAEVEAEPEA